MSEKRSTKGVFPDPSGDELKQEIALIRQIMEETKRVTRDNGKYYIFWGALVMVGLLLSYFTIKLSLGLNHGLIWLVCVGIGWIGYFIMGYKDKARQRSETFSGRVLMMIWLGCGIALTILGFVGTFTGGIKFGALSAVIATVLGVGYFVSSVLYPHKWFIYLAIGWWLGGIVTFFLQGDESILILALMIFALQMVPGLVLYSRYKKEIS